MNAKLKKAIEITKDSFWILLGLALYACSWNIFVLPHGFVGGGFGGISAMLYYQTGIPVSYWYFGFNVFLCIAALIVLGRDFSIKTVIGIIGLTLFLEFIPSPKEPEITNALLSAITGGIIGGAGVAFYLLRGASTGGSDIVVMIVSKYKNVSWGHVYLMFDSCVILSSLMLPNSTIETVAYGFVFMGVNVYTVDMISNGRRQSVQMFIFTSKYREIADQIIHRHHRGATLFESIGWFTKQHRKTIYLVARKRESEEIFRTVKAIDAHAFIAVSNVMSVFGMGFDAIKAGFTKAVLKDEHGNIIDSPSEMPALGSSPENSTVRGASDNQDASKPEASILQNKLNEIQKLEIPELDIHTEKTMLRPMPIKELNITIPSMSAPLKPTDINATIPSMSAPLKPTDINATIPSMSAPLKPTDINATIPSMPAPKMSDMKQADDEESTMTFAPPLDLLEVPLDSQDIILDDEKMALELQKAGKAAEYNPHWETPISELIDLQKMPIKSQGISEK